MLSKLEGDFKGEPGGNAESRWCCGRFSFAVGVSDAPIVMGIVNVTPDSFSDGGQYFDRNSAVAHGLHLADAGAQILDVGGESTRPGAPEVSAEEECARVLPIVEALAKLGHCVSIDTRKPVVMRAAIDAGASIVNDVYALRAEGAAALCARAKVGVVLMHMQGEPATMQQTPQYDDVALEVRDFLRQRAEVCIDAGISHDAIAIDPGFGFGKTSAHNLALTKQLRLLAGLGLPIVAGWSRKRTIGEITGQTRASERVSGSVAAALACVARGARVLRVHDARATVDALKVWRAIGGSMDGSIGDTP